MAMTDHFAHPLKTCRWANKEIAKFERAERRFFNKYPGSEWTEFDLTTGEVVRGLEWKVVPTEGMEESVYRIIGDLRNALDQAVYAGAKTLGIDRPKYAAFPVGDSEVDFLRRLRSPKGPYRDIPAALHPILESFEPFFPDDQNVKGNPLLRSLCDVANPNKHQVPLGIECQTGMKIYGMRGFINSIGTRWDGKGRTEILRYFPSKPYIIDMQLEPRIAFGEVARLAGKPVSRTFAEMLPLVNGIVNSIKLEAKRLANAEHQ